MTFFVVYALAGYSLVYVGMAFMSGRLLPAFPLGWRVIIATVLKVLGACAIFAILIRMVILYLEFRR